MKIAQIVLNGKKRGIFLAPTGDMKLSNTGDGLKLEYAGKSYDFGHLWWHYEFGNEVGNLCTKLMQLGNAVHIAGDTVSYWPCPAMSKLVEKLASMDTESGRFPMQFRHVTSRTVLGRKRFEMVVAYSGHYVAGSYIHDYTAAADYTSRLNKKLPRRSFQWLGYDDLNGHKYTFKFQYTV